MSILNILKKKTTINESKIENAKTEQVQQYNKETVEQPEYEIVEIEILPEKMICPDCGGITLVGLDFCDKCGGELINQDN